MNKQATSHTSSLLIAHCTAASTSGASCVGVWLGFPNSGSYTPVATRTECQPALLAPAISRYDDHHYRSVILRWLGIPESGLSWEISLYDPTRNINIIEDLPPIMYLKRQLNMVYVGGIQSTCICGREKLWIPCKFLRWFASTSSANL